MLNFEILTEVERMLLRNITLKFTTEKVPIGFNVVSMVNELGYRAMPSEVLKILLEELCQKGWLIKNEDGSYILTFEAYIVLRRRYKLLLFLNNIYDKLRKIFIFLWKHFIVTILTSVVTAYLTVKFTGK